VIVESASFTGCVMSVRPVGTLRMKDQGACDQKILATALGNPRYEAVREYRELDVHLLRSVEHFFSIYKELEGKRTATLGWDDAAAARTLIKSSAARSMRRQKSA
jgi:inorganic pyrophosphatase